MTRDNHRNARVWRDKPRPQNANEGDVAGEPVMAKYTAANHCGQCDYNGDQDSHSFWKYQKQTRKMPTPQNPGYRFH